MGLDYQFILIMQESNRDKLFEYVRKNGPLDYSGCASLHFEMDSFIFKYLEGGYDWKPHYDKSEIERFIKPNGKASIVCIYISIKKLDGLNDEIEVSFTAATSDMSRLFEDSISISKWFTDLSMEVNSIITYLDLEDDGARIIYFKGFDFMGDVQMKLKASLKSQKVIDFGGKVEVTFFEEDKKMYRFLQDYENFKICLKAIGLIRTGNCMNLTK
ncbi:hypothetical protein HQN90_00750 [Paenibacillus alba]|uniref:hypothetical protein n=1 Tax=Paenibacillus alba TaxID=1197127 RepID=UPI001563248D|nr:hypothetical protein [Paenibacillus alba]NQX64643.1 hypothetical protein [Paenibacillus alba]